MPAGPPPDELKAITPYLQRAAELQAKEPIVAYYCKFFAAKLALERASRTDSEKQYLLAIMQELEQDKKNLAGNEAITNDVVGYAHVENFALRIFFNADTEDRDGRASKKTAKTFLAASMFLELLKVFGEVDAEVKDKIRYSKFKAGDIIKALREGRVPTPGAPGEEPASTPNAPAEPHPDFGSPYDPSFDPAAIPPADHRQHPHSFEPNSYPPPGGAPYPISTTTSTFPASASSPSSTSAPIPTPKTPSHQQQPPQQQTAMSPTTMNAVSAAYDVSYKAVQAAQKHARFAISALQYDDVNNAVENLEKALALLKPFKK
ncbi:hypothetical protein HDU87_000042 [Geranomyces variabilis]|uniref:Uncharacterized protein n=1 Tax=Geranomyces variabilis TaxID=109894 RepID=A0AAD5TU33_9FUNG|nr:hypothetical protein HDU87_000042 [Geranomyces variabilis]